MTACGASSAHSERLFGSDAGALPAADADAVAALFAEMFPPGEDGRFARDDMAYPTFGSFKIGMKTIELRGFTGKVEDRAASTHTETTVDYDNRTTRTSTSHWVEFVLRDEDNATESMSAQQKDASVANGDTVTAFYGVVGGKNQSWLAFYNHKNGALGYAAKARNDLAGPFGYNMLIILAVIMGVFGVMNLFMGPGFPTFVMLALCVGISVWIYQRRKALKAQVDAAVASLQARRSAEPPATAAGHASS